MPPLPPAIDLNLVESRNHHLLPSAAYALPVPQSPGAEVAEGYEGSRGRAAQQLAAAAALAGGRVPQTEVRSRPPRGAAAQQLAAQSLELDAAQILSQMPPECAQRWAAASRGSGSGVRSMGAAAEITPGAIGLGAHLAVDEPPDLEMQI